MIPSKPSPRLKNEENYSKEFLEFIEICLKKEFSQRPSCSELLDHPFVKNTKSIFVLEDLLEEMHLSIKKAGSKLKAIEKSFVLEKINSKLSENKDDEENRTFVEKEEEKNEGNGTFVEKLDEEDNENENGGTFVEKMNDDEDDYDENNDDQYLPNDSGSFVEILDHSIIPSNGENNLLDLSMDASDSNNTSFNLEQILESFSESDSIQKETENVNKLFYLK